MNKHLYLCHPLVLSSPTLMMHGHMNLKWTECSLAQHRFPNRFVSTLISSVSSCACDYGG